MNKLISSALLIASLSGCASLGEDLAEGLAEFAVEAVVAIALSPFADNDDTKKRDSHHRQQDHSKTSAAWSAPMGTRQKSVQQ
jgi:hypothetical protein